MSFVPEKTSAFLDGVHIRLLSLHSRSLICICRCNCDLCLQSVVRGSVPCNIQNKIRPVFNAVLPEDRKITAILFGLLLFSFEISTDYWNPLMRRRRDIQGLSIKKHNSTNGPLSKQFLQNGEPLLIFTSKNIQPLLNALFISSPLADLLPVNLIHSKMLLQQFLIRIT